MRPLSPPQRVARVAAATITALLAAAPRKACATAPAVHAARGTPAVDGALDDPAWARAPWSARFVQRSPELGAPGTHTTRARILYDDRALYVGVECASRGRPAARLSRRDIVPAGDTIRVLVDGRGEGDSAFNFQVNPAGVEVDSIVQGDGNEDLAWDAIWTVEVRLSAHGWTAEYRIPWRVLRFDAGQPRFAIQIERLDFAQGETTALVPIPQGAPHYVAEFARLEDIAGVTPSRIFEVAPYVSGRMRPLRDPTLLSPLPLFSGNAGADVKFGLTQDLVLDATLNPDFGTVEVDPSVVNLSTFETFYPERRPFFLEGSELFQTPLQLLYTRRIGAPPPLPSPLHPDGQITTLDPTAPVWGAAKLSGRIRDLSLLVLEGVTGPAFAHESYSVARAGAPGFGPSARFDADAARLAAPATNWLAARARTPIGAGSTLGAIATDVGRIGQPNDVVGGVDWDWRAPDGVHRFRGQLAASNAWNPTRGQHAGEALFLEVSRAQSRVWLWTLRMRALSRDFDPNGLGYLDRADAIAWLLDTTFRLARPLGPFRAAYFNPYAWVTSNTEGLLIDGGAGVEVGATLRAQWTAVLGVLTVAPHFDDRETRGGFAYRIDPQAEVYASLTTDPRRPLRASLYADAINQNGGYRSDGRVQIDWLPAPFLTITAAEYLHLVTGVPRWVNTDVDGLGGHTYVFGRQDSRIYDSTLRAALALSRIVTVDVYAQLLYAQVHYDGQYSALIDPATLVPYASATDYSYDRVNLTINAIARYEYQRGAFFSLVLLHRAEVFTTLGSAGFDTGLGMLGLGRPDTEVLAKLTYLII